MHTLEDIRREYDRLDRLCGVDTRSIRLKQSPTSVQRLGAFRYPLRTGGRPLQISVSPVVLQNDNLFLDTIRHEYAHALVYLRTGENHGHDALWKDACREVGCNPAATTPMDDTLTAARIRQARYRIVCHGCGSETYYLREGKIVKAIEAGLPVRCARCGAGKLTLYERADTKK